MKKITTKKLSLARETLVNLEAELRDAVGGSGIISSDNKACTYSKLQTACFC
jgi:hypothetical protein